MLRGTTTAFLTLATICMTGCAKSDFVVQPHRQKAPQPGQAARIYNAPPEVPPKILPETYFAAGSLLEAQGLLGGAIQQYQKATVVNHNYVAAYHRLGLLLSAVGHHERATKALRRAVVLLPDNATLHNNLGYSLMLQQLWADAERQFSRALELSPGFPRAHINRGMVQSKLGRFDVALASFEAVLPETAAYYNLGLMYRAQHRFEKAVETFRHVLSINPGFTAASTQLEQLAPHFPPALPSELVAGADGPVAQEKDTTIGEQLPTPSGPVVSDELGPPITAAVSMDRITAVEPLTPFETMPELIAAFGEFREYPPTAEEGEQLPTPSGPVVSDELGPPFTAAVSMDRVTPVEPLTPFETMPEMFAAFGEFREYPPTAEEWEELSTPSGQVVSDELGPPITAAVSMDRITAVEPLTPSETMPETFAAFGEFREYLPTAEEVEAQLQVVRNEIDCLEDLEAQEQDEFTLNFADLVSEPEPLVVSDASVASEADFVADEGEEEESFASWLSAPSIAQLTLDELLGILPPPKATPVQTMGMSIVPPDPDTIDACPADQPEIASHAFAEEEPDPCEEEEQTQDRDRQGAALQDS